MNVRPAKVLSVVAAALLAVGSATSQTFAATTFNWVPTSPGIYDWDTPASNWGGTVADGAGNVAVFSAANPAGIVVNVNNPHTIGDLVFSSRATGSGWTLGGSSTLTLDNNGTNPLFTFGTTVPAGDATAPVILLAAPTATDQATINTQLAGTTGVLVGGTGTLVIGPSVYTSGFTGSTILNSSLANSVALTFAGDNANVKAIQFGVVTNSGSVNTGNAFTASMNVNANVTATNMVVQTQNLTGQSQPGPANVVTVAPSKILTLAPPSSATGASAISVGYDLCNTQTSSTAVFTGNQVNINLSTTQNISVGVNNAGSNNMQSILDLSRLSDLEVTSADNTTELRVGGGLATGTGNRALAWLSLSSTANITVGTVTVGGGSNGTGATSQIVLGRGLNTFNVKDFYVGTAKSPGVVGYVFGNYTQNTSGSLKIRGFGGGDGDRANINLATDPNNLNGITGVTGQMLLNDHNVDIKADVLTLGARPATSANLTGNFTGTLQFNNGIIDANKIVMAVNTTPLATGTVAGAITVGGSAASTATLAVGAGSGVSIDLGNVNTGATAPAQVGVANGTLTISTNGTVQTAGSIDASFVPTTSTGTPTISLSGGTLDLGIGGTSHAIGPSAGTVVQGFTLKGVTITATSGTLKNVSNINNVTTGTTALTKTGAGTLTIAGNNTYAGNTVVNGTAVTAGLAGVAVTGKLADGVVVNNGILAGNGNGTTSGVVGGVTLNSTTAGTSTTFGSGRIAPGATLADGDIGTLTVSSLTLGASGGDLRFDLNDAAVPSSNDQIVSSGAVAFNGGANTMTVSLGSIPKAGTYTLITAPATTMTGTAPNIASATATLYAGSRLTLGAPTIVGNTSLQLTVTGATKSLTWSGGAAGTWDLNNAQNWNSQADKFFNLDAVTIPDPTTTTTITIPNNTSPATVLQPASVTVNNSSGHDVTITSPSTVPGSLSGNMSLTKTGNGTLFLSTPNTYTGATTISGGKLVLTATGGIVPSAATGAFATISIGASGTLQFGNGDQANATATNTGLGTAPIANGGTFGINILRVPGTSAVGSYNVSGTGLGTPVPIGNVISGGGSIQKDGTGYASLTATNTGFTGPVVVNAGVLRVGNVFALGAATSASPITVNSGATLDLETNSNSVLNFGPRQITIAGAGAPIGTNSQGVGAIFVGSGRQQQNAIQNLKLTADSSVTGGGRLEVKNGTLDLAGFTLTNLSGQFAINNSTVTNGNIIVSAGANVNLESAFVGGTGTISIGSGGILRITGANPGTITRNIVFQGNGTIQGNIDTTSFNGPAISTNTPATIDSNILLQGNMSLTSASTGTNTVLLRGNISEDAAGRGITLVPVANLIATVILSGTNTFDGGVTIGNTTNISASLTTTGMLLQLGSSNALNAAGTNTVTFGSNAITGASGSVALFGMRLNGFDATIAGLNTIASGTEFVENGTNFPSTLTINNTNPSTFSGVLQDKASTNLAATGKLALVKNGPGLFTLTSTLNTFTGGATVNGGTLFLNGGSIAGNGTTTNAVTINGGGTLAGTGTAGNTSLASLSAATPSVISPGTAASIATLTVNSLSVNNGELKVNLGNSGNSDTVSVTTTASFLSGGTTKVTPSFNATPTSGATYNLVMAAAPVTTVGHVFTVNVPANTRFSSTPPTVSAVGNNLQLQFTVGAKVLTWTGGVSGSSTTWDLIGASNFSNDGSTANNDQFYNVDAVTFGSGSFPGASTNVTLAAGVSLQPSSTTIAQGTFTVGGSGSIGGPGSLTVNTGATLNLNNSTANTYTGQTLIQGTGRLNLGGSGALPVGGAVAVNDSGVLDLNGNSITVSDLTNNSTTGIIGNSSGTLATITSSGDNSNYQGAIRDGIGGSGGQVGLTVSSGTLTLSDGNASNTANGTNYSGPTLVQNNATLKVGVANAFSPKSPITLGQGATGGNIDLNGFGVTVASINSDAATTGSVVIGNNGSGVSILTVDPVAAGLPATTPSSYAGRLQDTVTPGIGTGTLALVVNSGVLTLSGANTFTGGSTGTGQNSTQTSVTIAGGTLSLGANNVLGTANTSGLILMSGGKLQYTSGVTTDYSSRFSQNSTAFNIDVAASTNVTFASALTALSASLTKTGAGTLTLGGASVPNTTAQYGGATTISEGTLALASSNHVSDTSMLVFNGGTFATGGNSDTVSSLSVTAANSVLDMGAGASTLTLGNSSASNTWTSTLRINNWTGNVQTVQDETMSPVTANTGSDHIVTNNTTDFIAGQLAQIQFTGFYHTGPAQLINQYNPNGDGTYTSTGRFELAPTTAALKVGDVDLNQVVDIGDVGTMMTALSNLNAYDAQSPQSGYQASELSTVFNTFTPNDNQRNNLDLQALIVLLANGGSPAPSGGNLTAVPEPASFVLLGIGGAIAMATAYRRRSLRR